MLEGLRATRHPVLYPDVKQPALMRTRSAGYLVIGVLACGGGSPAAPQQQLQKPDPPARADAPIPLDTLLMRLHAASPQVRAKAAGALSGPGPRVEDRVRALRGALSDPDRTAGQSAAWALGNIGAPSVPALVEALSDSRPVVRIRALYGLAKVGQPAASAREAMQRAMLDPDRSVSKMASWAVGQIGPRPSRGAGAADLGTATDLRAGLAAPDPQARESAVRRFQPYIADAQTAIPLLVRALADSDASVRAAAADVLVTLGSPAREALAAALSDPDPVVRREASVALVRLGAPR